MSQKDMNKNNCKLAMWKHPPHFSFCEYSEYIIIFYSDFEIMDRKAAVAVARGNPNIPLAPVTTDDPTVHRMRNLSCLYKG